MSALRDYAASVAQPTLPLSDGGEAAARFDEVVGPDGALRPAWKGFASIAVDLTSAELHRIDAEIAGLLADDGVTYGAQDRGSQPWRLDPMPLVLDAASWSRLDIGLAQRAELLGALLADLYGPQTLLAEGIIPAEIVFGHAGFARAMARQSASTTHQLLLSGVDLGRDADGEWHVLADRVQAPSGLGYAMENRRVLSRALPELYEDAGLHRIEPYFSALRATLLEAAPTAVAEARVVVLSPGTHSETAYDQAFLANILGFPLVQGEDLVVDRGAVWIRPSGDHAPTERVDVILRRVDAEWCDPLELRGDSQLGVAGLAEAVRRGSVRLVNGLGAGVLENPALIPFLPAVCERLLGEQLRLPSAPTWWCGDADGREHVLRALAADPASVIVRTLDGRAAELADLAPDELRARILAAPLRHVGQARMPLSQAPRWRAGAMADTGRAVPHPLVLRTFTIRDGAAYRPLAGGLATFVDEDADAPRTKDVWVLKAASSDPDQGVVDTLPTAMARAVPVLAPRAVEDMFWAGRYAERAEDLLRLVITARAHAEQLDYTSSTAGVAALRSLVGTLQRLCGTRWLAPDEELRSLLLDADRVGSAAHSLARLREALEGVRDQLSGDTWRVFATTDRAVQSLRSSSRTPLIAESAGRMLSGILSLQGVTANMMRDDGWNAIEVGRYLERAAQVCTLLAATTTEALGIGADRAVLTGVLMAAESSVTHRRRYRGAARLVGVLELLLTDRDNPRSVAFALGQVRARLSGLGASTGSTRPERLLQDLEQRLESTDVGALTGTVDGARPELAGFLAEVQVQLHQLGDAIVQVHFEAGPLPQPISSLSMVEEARR